MSEAKTIDVEAAPLAVAVREPQGAVGILRPADSLDAIADAFRQYQQVCERILGKDDYQTYEGKPRKKKSAWRKLATAFNVSTRVVEKEIERDTERNVLSAFFTVEAQAGNRVTNGSGYCEVTEKCCAGKTGKKCRKAAWKGHYCCESGCDGRKHWSHANHDIIATAETRAKNRAIADLIGCGEVSAEELTDDATPSSDNVDFENAAPKASPAPPPKPAAPAAFPTDAMRTRMITLLKAGPGEANQQIVREYFEKLSQLLPTEDLTDLPLRFVPMNKAEMDSLVNCVENFSSGGDVVRAFEPHAEIEQPVKQGKAAPAAATTNAEDQPWFKFIVPIPHKGESKAEYIRHPDTIGSLYEARHGTDDIAQEARQRLWGFCEHYEPKGWTKRDGTEMPPSESDLKFREMLNDFKDWFSDNHPDEKL